MRLLNLTICAVLAGCASTATENRGTWQVTTQDDPITGISRCVVTAPDAMLGSSFTRSTRLYPFVEKNSDAGLIVGVSTGGKVRFTPGDVVWRVDQNSPRTFTMAGTPIVGKQSNAFATGSMTAEQQQAYESAMQMTAGMTSSIQNGITAVGGEEAESVLAELKGGDTLIFRSVAAAPSAGLPTSGAYEVGQIKGSKITPIPLDESFNSALAECGL